MHHRSKSPCKDCKERSTDPPCHDRCEKYLAYQKDMIEIRKQVRKDTWCEGIHIELTERNLRRYRGGKGIKNKWSTK